VLAIASQQRDVTDLSRLRANSGLVKQLFLASLYITPICSEIFPANSRSVIFYILAKNITQVSDIKISETPKKNPTNLFTLTQGFKPLNPFGSNTNIACDNDEITLYLIRYFIWIGFKMNFAE